MRRARRCPPLVGAGVVAVVVLLGACGTAGTAAGRSPRNGPTSGSTAPAGTTPATPDGPPTGAGGTLVAVPPEVTAIVEQVRAALARSRAAADEGVRLDLSLGEVFDTSTLSPVGYGSLRIRFDGTRVAERTAAGRRRVLDPSGVYLLVPSRDDIRAKARLGVPRDAWVVHRSGDSVQDPGRHLDLVLWRIKPRDSWPDWAAPSARTTTDEAGRTVLELSSDPDLAAWTLDAAGRVVDWRSQVDDSREHWTLTYGPQTITLPTTTVDGERYDDALRALGRPPLVVDPAGTMSTSDDAGVLR